MQKDWKIKSSCKGVLCSVYIESKVFVYMYPYLCQICYLGSLYVTFLSVSSK